MAQVFPPVFPHRDDPMKWAEGQAFDAFSKLSDDWFVLYSVTWFGPRNGKQQDGEADFILMHPEFGILIVEVKGGSEILVRDGVWYSRKLGELNEIRNPFEQAADSKFFLLKWLSSKFKGSEFKVPHCGHFVVFPAHKQDGDLGPSGNRSLICDKLDLLDPAATVERIARFGGLATQSSTEVLERIRRLLLPDLHIPTMRRAVLVEAQKAIVELTSEQDRALSMLRDAPNILVRGAAGTGKTVLAINDAIRAASSGLETLFLCFNRPLADLLRRETDGIANLTVNSFHAFAHTTVQSVGLGIDIDEDEDLPYHLVQAAEVLKLNFDVLVVDEAQDFLSDWWDALESMVKSDFSRIHIFADSAQDIYDRSGLERFNSYTPVHLSVNCRNTLEIAAHVNRCGQLDSAVRGAHGIEPFFEEVLNWDDIRSLILKYLDEWTDQLGIPDEDISILTDSSALADALFESEIGRHRLLDGRQSSVRVDTIHRFKGLESEAVLCIFDPLNEPALPPEKLRRYAYVGFSRPRTVLAALAAPHTLRKIRTF